MPLLGHHFRQVHQIDENSHFGVKLWKIESDNKINSFHTHIVWIMADRMALIRSPWDLCVAREQSFSDLFENSKFEILLKSEAFRCSNCDF